MILDKSQLGSAIRQVRALRGLTQTRLAIATGLSESRSSIASIEQGRRAVSPETLRTIATALDIPSGCLAVMGSSAGDQGPAADELVSSIRELISSVIEAQQH